MNILYLAHRIPYPPDKGDKLRAFRQIEYLSRNHGVWCACFVDQPSDRAFAAPLSAHCVELAAIPLGRKRAALRGVRGLMCGGTITEAFYRHPAMQAQVAQWCASVRFDAVVAFSSSMAQYGQAVPRARRILDMCDADSIKWNDYANASGAPMRWLYRLEGRRLALRERAWSRLFDATLLVSEAEARGVRHEAGNQRVHVVGNGVSLPYIDRHRTAGRSAGLTVGFVGAMDYRPNVEAVGWFAAKCWPMVLRAFPAARFRIVGRSPARAVRRLGNLPGVDVVGGVDDVTAEVLGFDVSVCPLHIARGVQNKVLEAMAAARAVVLSPSAAEGIDACDGHDYVVADTAAQTAAAVMDLLEDPQRRKELGSAARRFVAKHRQWKPALERFETIVAGGRILATSDKPRETMVPAGAQVPTQAQTVRTP